MKIDKDESGQYFVSFTTQYGTTGTVGLETDSESVAVDRVRAMRVEHLEGVAKICDLTQQVVGQIITGRTIRLDDAIALWHQSVVSRRLLSRNTIATNVCLLKDWSRVEGLGGRILCSIGPEDIAKYLLRGNERRTTALRKLSAIRSFFNFLFHEGLVLRNPAAKGLVKVSFDPFTHNEKEIVEKTVFTPEEIAALTAAADPVWRAIIFIARDTGLRLSDIVQLEWSSINSIGSTLGSLPVRKLVVWTDKSNTRVSLDTTADIERSLAELPTTGITSVFPDQCAIFRDVKRRAGLSVHFSRLCKRCGISGRSFHSLRHTYVTTLRDSGLTLEQVAANVGHTDVSSTRTYDHSRYSGTSAARPSPLASIS